MARLIPVCGRARWVYPQKPPYFSVRELCEHVRTNGQDCFIELVVGFQFGSYAMLVSETGSQNNLAVNESASLLARSTIRGNALLVTDRECDDLPLLRSIYSDRLQTSGGSAA